MRARAIVVAAVLLAAWPCAAQATGRCGSHPWCDTSLSPDRRADLLIGALTPAERISLLAGDDPQGITGRAGTHTGAALGVPRLDLPPLYLTDGPVGVRQGQSTAFPSSIALAASFNRRLARRAGALVGNEAKLKGNDVVYAPTVNLLRTPLWGRAFESLGEDPFLTARMGVEWIRGAQSQGVIANVKHFAANNQEDHRYSVDARVDERTLFELYLPQFEAAVKEGHAGAVMCSYNRVNGPHACENRWLLQRVLRRRWGFRGFVLADYGASKRIGSGLRAGLDFEPFPFIDYDGGEVYAPAPVEAAIASGRTTQAAVDRAVHRLLRTLFAHRFFDRAAYVDDESRIDRTGHARVSRRLAEAGIVLLQNIGRALPLDAKRLKSLAVIGADADAYKNGGGSSSVQPYSVVTPRQGITTRAGPGVDVRYDPGEDPARAAEVARTADAAVVVVADAAGEGADKPCLSLDCGAGPGLKRDELIEAVAAANDRTIVVLETAGPVLTPWRHRVKGIVEAWYPGSAGGTAIARVLFGDIDPGGRLPATFPWSARAMPTAGDRRRYPGVGDVVRYSERGLVGYRWYQGRRAPAFQFGWGVSYARVEFRDWRVRRHGRGAIASLVVRNRSRRSAVAVPQVYVSAPHGVRQLKGFESVALRGGQRKRVRFELDSRAFSYWDSRRDRWRVAPGCYRVEVASSAQYIVSPRSLAMRGGRCR